MSVKGVSRPSKSNAKFGGKGRASTNEIVGDMAWESMLRQLAHYKSLHGHCFVPLRCPENPKLGAWLSEQIEQFRKGRLAAPRQRALEGLGLVWDFGDSRPARARRGPEGRWEERFAELVAFQKQHGHLRVTKSNQTSPGLMHWRDNQRINLRAGTLTLQRKARLDAIGFEWETPGRLAAHLEEQNVAHWESMFAQLLAYKAAHGHCDVPSKCKANPALGRWVNRQRLSHKHGGKYGVLASDRKARLEEIGFTWQSEKRHATAGWEDRFAELVAFKQQHGHLRITKSNQSSPGLEHWRDNQRLNLRAGRVTPEQKARLDAIDFVWESPGRSAFRVDEQNEALWERLFQQLVDYKAAHGHCLVPAKWKNNPHLAAWVILQRRKYSHGHKPGNPFGRLSPERRARLEEIGFTWKPNKGHFTDGWEGRFAQLVAFKQQHGHLRVTKSNQSSPGLMHWRDNQRINLRAGKVTPERKARLDAIGFEWACPGRIAVHMEEQNVALWERMFAQLLDYKQAHGHCQVPTGWNDNPTLAKWVGRQRSHNNQGHLPPDRKARLDQIGFAWKSDKLPMKSAWERRFAELVAFQRQHGHLAITITNQSSPGFAHWRDNQRILHRQGKLAPERKAQLDAIGFAWQAPAQPPRSAPSARQHVSTTAWEQGFEKLVAFERENGHTDVPTPWPEDPALALWVKQQRIAHEYRRLSRGQIARLDALGFPWALDSEVRWQARHAELAAFHSQQGHCHPSHHTPETRGLAEWLAGQRKAWREGRMPPARLKQLEALNWQQPPPVIEQPAKTTTWDIRFAELKAFLQSHGHTRIPKRQAEFKTLCGWVKSQRVYRRKGTLNPWHREQLDAIGFDWRPSAAPRRPVTQRPAKPTIWDIRFGELKAFLQSHGHTRIPKTKTEFKTLCGWVKSQRVYHRKGTLNPWHREQLDAIGFDWKPSAAPPRPVTQRPAKSTTWDIRFAELKAFLESHGHTRIPKRQASCKTLRSWVTSQRIYYRKGTLNPWCREQLDSIGFDWKPSAIRPDGSSKALANTIWEQRYQQLLDFKARHGHTRVPVHRGEDKTLGSWVVSQRVYHRQGTLKEHLVRRLDEIGFVWNPQASQAGLSAENSGIASSDARFAELLAFREQHGHVEVPTKYPANPLLGNWVSNTRISYKKGQLSAARIQQLEALGFVWAVGRTESVNRSYWERRFAELLAFKELTGHVNVPSKYKANPGLASWVVSQRSKRRRGTLVDKKVQRLEAIGFQWFQRELQPGRNKSWEQRYAELVAYRQQHGHAHVSKRDPRHRTLGLWVRAQRLKYHAGKLQPDQIAQLNALGFVWDVLDDRWQQSLQQWLAATQQLGQKHLTKINRKHSLASQWEAAQRHLHRHGQLSADRFQKLDALGFIWVLPGSGQT